MSCCVFSPIACLNSGISSFLRGWIEAFSPFPLSCIHLLEQSVDPTFIVTGGNRGVGFYTAKILLQRNYQVFILCRSEKNGNEAREVLVEATGNTKCIVAVVNLKDISSIHRFTEYVNNQKLAISGLVNNAGMIGRDSILTNHIGHFFLTMALIPALKRGAGLFHRAYVINVASVAHIEGSTLISSTLDNHASFSSRSDWTNYSISKAANVLFGLSFERYHQLTLPPASSIDGISVLSYHPGVMLTDLWKGGSDGEIQESSERSLQLMRNICFCCVKHPIVAAIGLSSLVDPPWLYRYLCNSTCPSVRIACMGSDSGGYFQQCCCCCVVPVRPSPPLLQEDTQRKLWTSSMQYIDQLNDLNFSSVLNDYRIPLENGSLEKLPYLCHAAYPGSECLAAAPYCFCFSILF